MRRRPFVAGCLALKLLLVLANVFLWHARATAAREHDEVRRQGELLLRTLANRARIDADLAALTSANGQIQRNLADEQSMEVNLGYFYRLEKNARIRLVRLNQLASPPPAAGSPFKTVQFSLQATGTYRNLVTFLRSLETGPRLVRLRHGSVERGPVDAGELTLDLTLEILAKP